MPLPLHPITPAKAPESTENTQRKADQASFKNKHPDLLKMLVKTASCNKEKFASSIMPKIVTASEKRYGYQKKSNKPLFHSTKLINLGPKPVLLMKIRSQEEPHRSLKQSHQTLGTQFSGNTLSSSKLCSPEENSANSILDKSFRISEQSIISETEED
mmetsp:Transcript_40768/g.46727  ORF Transcript_40768/g.46727 Transcript_40768/m.46727 type:complete len:158 (+) Transcript_40768:509-982(+)